MNTKKFIGLSEEDLLRMEQIVIDHDKDDAFAFVKEVIKKRVDGENAAQMRRENNI
jgi:hypothetical protein